MGDIGNERCDRGHRNNSTDDGILARGQLQHSTRDRGANAMPGLLPLLLPRPLPLLLLAVTRPFIRHTRRRPSAACSRGASRYAPNGAIRAAS